MITVEEHIIDNITGIFYKILKGDNPKIYKLPENYPDNEIRQLINYVNSFVIEYNEFSNFMYSIARGELDYNPPAGKMRVIQSFKSLQSNLKHLTWKTQQIAAGDFEQKVDFMGDFSQAFNKMTIQLKEAFTKLEELNAAKNRFFSIIGHDLKNPFTSLLGYSQYLQENADELDKTEIIKMAGIINDSANNSYKLLDNLLKWALSQTGRLEFQPRAVSIKTIIDDSIKLLQSSAVMKTIEIKSLINQDYFVIADFNMIDTVIRNLISNAIKFTDSGSIIINCMKSENNIIISIKDSGVGILKEDIPKLFRIDVKNSEIGGARENKGTGLGLILCKEFITKNNGSIKVESEINKGSEFIITLPALIE